MRIKKNNTLNSIQKKQIIALAGGVALAGVLVALVLTHLPGRKETLARESFTDMKNIVDDHLGDGNEFRILDIVPSKAAYTPTGDSDEISLELSTATMGYLVKGFEPITDVIIGEITTPENSEKLQKDYRLYSQRIKLGSDLVKNLSYSTDVFRIAYQEAYTGASSSISESDSWTLVGDWKESWSGETAASYYFNNYCEASDRASGAPKAGALSFYETNEDITQGFIYGKYEYMSEEQRVDSTTGEALWGLLENADINKGYDYILLTDLTLDSKEVSDQDGPEFTFNNDINRAVKAKAATAEEEGDSNLFSVTFEKAKRDDASDYVVTDEDLTLANVKGYKLINTGSTDEEYIYLTRCAQDPEHPELPYWQSGDQVYLPTTFKALAISATDGSDSSICTITNINTGEKQSVFHFPHSDSSEPKVKTQAFLYVGSGMGNYKLTETKNTADTPMELLNAPVYIRTVSENDLLRKYVFAAMSSGQYDENNKDTFKITVDTIYAADTELAYGAKTAFSTLVEKADLIYLENGYGSLLETKRGDITLSFIEKYNSGDEGDQYHAANDMKGDIALAILNRAASEDVAVIVDHGAVTGPETAIVRDEYKGTVYQRLAKILEKQYISKYFNDRIEGKNTTDEKIANLFKQENVDSDSYPSVTSNDYNYVNNKIYVINDTSLLNGKYNFYEKINDNGYDKSGFTQVLDAIEIDNTNLSDDDQIAKYASKARAIQYILVDVRARYNDICILEIQPTINANSDLHVTESGSGDEYTKTLYWQKANLKDGESAPEKETILVADREIKITIVRQSVEEFNSSLEDINSLYDMIFIGLDGSRLNTDVGAFSDGKVYTLGSSGYDAVDLTTAKKQALFNYMRAGFPIVVEGNCFNGGTTSNDYSDSYLQSGTNFQSFLSDGKADYGNFLYTPKDAQGSGSFVKQVNLAKPTAAYKDGGSPSVSADKKLSFTYEVNDGITRTYHDGDETKVDGPSYYGGSLSYEFYYDMNCDGVFSQDEMVPSSDVYQSNGQVIVDVSDCSVGITPFAFKVFDSENEFKRYSLTGYVKILEPVTIKVLQIVASRDLDGTMGYDLQTMYEKENMLLGQKLKDAEGLIGAAYSFETRALTDMEDVDIEDYDLIVLGFGPDYTLSGDVLEAVNTHISSGKGLVVSSVGGDLGRMGLSADSLSMLDQSTYSSGASPYKYLKLSGDSFGYRFGLTVTRINDGIVSHYPYEVADGQVMNSAKAGSYLLDYSRNVSGTLATSHDTATSSAITVWYVLSGYNGESTDGDTYSTCYTASPRDGRNNYYIYSVDNVYYLGQKGYPFLEEASDGVTECELFVNTLMGAYNSCIKSPRIEIVSGYGQDAYSIESITIPYDQEFSGVGNLNVNFFFRYSDPNRCDGEKVTVNFYYGSETKDGSLPADAVLKNGDWNSVFYVINHAETGAFIPGAEYTVDSSSGSNPWPVNTVYQVKRASVDSSYANKRLYAEVIAQVKKGGRTYILRALDSVSLVGASLFDLD